MTTNNATKNYIGLTEGTFKQRFSQHKATFKHRKYTNSTELSKSCIPRTFLLATLSNQAGKGRVFYSVDNCFETGADPRNIFHKQIFENLDAVFGDILLCDSARDFDVQFESSRHREIFEFSSRAVKKSIGSYLKV